MNVADLLMANNPRCYDVTLTETADLRDSSQHELDKYTVMKVEIVQFQHVALAKNYGFKIL